MSSFRSRRAAGLLVAAFLPLAASASLAKPLAPGEGAEFNSWVRIVQSRLIKSAQRSHGFPRSARVVVRFSVNRDGSVADVHATSSSDPDPRYPGLAERAVALAGPYPPIPASYVGQHVQFVVPLVFDATSRVRLRNKKQNNR